MVKVQKVISLRAERGESDEKGHTSGIPRSKRNLRLWQHL